MKLFKQAIAFLVLFIAYGTASAGTMNCGTHIISDGQLQGQSREEVREKCGAPTKEVYGEVFYKIDGVTYQLRFNGNNELDTITVVEQE